MNVAASEQNTPELTLAGTFTLEPIEEVLTFWLQQYDVHARLSLAPYAQVFPQLLDPGSLLRTRRSGLNVVLVRLEDWLGPSGNDTQALWRAVTECAAALQAAVDGSPVPCLFVSCPPSPDNGHARVLEERESGLREACDRLGVAFVGSQSLIDDYALAGWHDAYRLKEAHIPYTAPAIAAIGTSVARHFLALTRAPVKAVVLDCDHTLWGGVVGEDGPAGVVIDEPRRALQAQMRALGEQGMLLCLCSKNDEADVLEVFARRGAEMALSLEDIAARRINWRPKSENLRDLARELSLGLDSFVMLDDNPLECAEVTSGCPPVTVLRVPQDASEIPRFLKHCWVFDRATAVTAEDRGRAAMVAAEREREANLARTPSLEEFVATLALEIAITPLAPEHHARVSQLSLRTNQFNLSGRRRRESELRQALAEGLRGFVVHLRDRFGDYGLVGTVLYREDDSAIVVDSWFLSCRALGRGVEHRMLAELGQLALQGGCAAVVLPLVATDRNAPIRAFLEEVAQRESLGSGTQSRWRINAQEAVATRWQPHAGGRERPAPEPRGEKQREARQPRVQELLATIPSAYSTGAAIAEAVQQMARASAADRPQKREGAGESSRAGTPLERQILGLFREVLADDVIGLDADFFQLGGHSLLATTLMGLVAAECGVDVPLHVLFENPTPAGIAAAVERARVASDADRAIAREERPAHSGPVGQVLHRRVARPQPFDAVVPVDDRTDVSKAAPESVVPLPEPSEKDERDWSRLTTTQAGVWAAHSLRPDQPTWSVPLAVRICGPIDPLAFARAFAALVRSADSLRMVLREEEGVPWQQLKTDSDAPIDIVDLRGAGNEAVEEWLKARAARVPDLAHRHFDTALLRLADAEYLWFFNQHHLFTDGWTNGLLLQRMSRLYLHETGTEEMVPGVFPPLLDRVRDIRRYEESNAAAVDRQYFTDLLDEEIEPYKFFGVSAKRTGATIARHTCRVDPEHTRRLRATAAEVGDARHGGYATRLHFIASVLVALLHRMTGRRAVAIGVPYHNRHAGDDKQASALLRQTPGLFADVLPLVVNLEPTDSFARITEKVRESWARAVEHARGGITAEVRRRACDVVLNYGNVPIPQLFGAQTSVMWLATGHGFQSLAIGIDDADSSSEMEIRFDFQAEVFPEDMRPRIVDRFLRLIDACTEDPARAVSTIPLLPEDERVQVVEEWSRTPASGTTGTPVPDLIGVQADAASRSNLTNAQMATWMTQVMYPGVPITYMPSSVRIRGTLDVSAFGRAFHALVASTDALRMVIREEDGVPIQEEDPDCDASLELVEMAGATDEEIDCWLRDRCARPPDAHRRSFDSVLLTIGPSDHLWFFQQHHVFGDGWSSLMIRDRLSRFYRREMGEPVDLPGTFPRWQDAVNDIRAYQSSAAGIADRAHLASLITDDIEAVQFFGLPHQKNTTVVVRNTLTLDSRATRKLRARAAESSKAGSDAAKFYLIGAALAAYLHRVTGRRWVAFGAPYHNRRSTGDRQAAARLPRTCGLFMDVLPVVVEVEQDDTFARLIEKVRDAWADASRHALGGTPSEVRQRGCDVLLNYLPPMPEQLFGTTTTVTWVHPGHEIESLAIQVRDYEQSERVEFMFDFHADVFPEAMRPRVIAQFTRMIDACMDEPSRRVRTVDLLTEDQRVQVLEQWNDTSVPGTTDRLVTDLFDEQVARNPLAVAVETDDERVRYEDLRGRAARVAGELTRQGAGPDTVVGLCLPRSAAQIAALLGILRAGAAYLPLDPVLPDDRIETVLEDAGVTLVVTARALRGRRPFESRRVVTIEDVDSAPVASSVETPHQVASRASGSQDRFVEQRVSPASLAYVMYTSGSTGTPKGVEITHAGLANFVSFAVSYFALTSADRVLQFASLSFDTAAEEIFSALAAGATLVLRTDRMLDSVDEFLDGCVHRSITLLDLPTAYWHTVIDVAATRREFPPNIRAVILGGEAVRPDMLARWRQWVGTRVMLLNGYGPTETTVCATYTDLTCAPETPQGPVSIGRPVWNTRAYVLDAAGEPVAPGLAGELHVGGVGLARGYRHAPEMTAARFIADPWHPGERLYRTGDRARWRLTGELEYLGRLDQQVKVRGYRVEPGEIEARLHAHPAIREAAVVAQVVDGDTRLVAYVCAARNPVTVSELREFLAARLPGYMVPHAFVLLDRLPRLLSGKVDRRALPAPAAGAGELVAVPRTPAETAIAGIWSDLLGLPSVGTDQNFFDLGGHSLLGTRIVARIADALGVSVPLWMLFEHPTVAGLAAALTGAAASGRAPAPSSAVAAERRGAKRLTRAKRTPASSVSRAE